MQQIKAPAGAHIFNLMHQAKDLTPLNKGLYVDLKSYLVDNCLVKVDRMSMAASLEARVPFLDKDLVELAFRVPDRYKVSGRQTKILLKKVAARKIPHDCVYRPKEGFSIPIKNWLHNELRPLLDDLTNEKRIKEEGIFRSETISRLKREHQTGVANHSHTLWAIIVFESWRRRFLTSPRMN
jgi:asparagine synthase (glutamine-hydrolysing)